MRDDAVLRRALPLGRGLGCSVDEWQSVNKNHSRQSLSRKGIGVHSCEFAVAYAVGVSLGIVAAIVDHILWESTTYCIMLNLHWLLLWLLLLLAYTLSTAKGASNCLLYTDLCMHVYVTLLFRNVAYVLYVWGKIPRILRNFIMRNKNNYIELWFVSDPQRPCQYR